MQNQTDQPAQIDPTEHLGLVTFVIKKHFSSTRLEYDDLFQIGCIGLIKATRAFEPSRGAFSSFAVKVIWQTIANALQHDRRKNAPTISLDKPITGDGGDSFLDTLPAEVNVEKTVANHDAVKRALQSIGPTARTIILMRADGKTQDEIARAMGTSIQNVQQCIKRAHERLARKGMDARD